MFNFIDIYIFILVSGCVGRGPSVLLWPGAYNAVKLWGPLLLALKEVDPVGLHRQSGIHAQEILKFLITWLVQGLISPKSDTASYRMGTLGSFPGGPCLSMHVVYGMFFLRFKHWFWWKNRYNKYMFNFIDIYIFILVSGSRLYTVYL
jgi:hypothetical protein